MEGERGNDGSYMGKSVRDPCLLKHRPPCDSSFLTFPLMQVLYSLSPRPPHPLLTRAVLTADFLIFSQLALTFPPPI